MNVNQKKLYPSIDNEKQQVASRAALPVTAGGTQTAVQKQPATAVQKQTAVSGQNGGYASKWQAGLDSTMDKILNREEFKFDLNGDALMKQYSDLYTMQGKKAMMDTMAQASALTGGYGSSYAQNAGQQAYQGYIQQMNDRIPELYQLALDKYSMEGEDLRNQYSLLAGLEEQDYGRYRDQIADGRYDQEFQYQQGRDQIEDQRYDEQWEYQKDRDRIEDERWQAEFDEDKRRYDQEYEPESGGSGGNPISVPEEETEEPVEETVTPEDVRTNIETHARNGASKTELRYEIQTAYRDGLINAAVYKELLDTYV